MGLGRIIGAYIVSAFKRERRFNCYGSCKYFSGSLNGGKCSARQKSTGKLELALPGYICVNQKEGRAALEAHNKWINTPRRQSFYTSSNDPNLGEP